jgi:hypothetical protein
MRHTRHSAYTEGVDEDEVFYVELEQDAASGEDALEGVLADALW